MQGLPSNTGKHGRVETGIHAQSTGLPGNHCKYHGGVGLDCCSGCSRLPLLVGHQHGRHGGHQHRHGQLPAYHQTGLSGEEASGTKQLCCCWSIHVATMQSQPYVRLLCSTLFDMTRRIMQELQVHAMQQSSKLHEPLWSPCNTLA